jgi:hypothetical protein
MKRKSSSEERRWSPAIRIGSSLGAALLEITLALPCLVPAVVSGGTPEWLREVAKVPHPAYPEQIVAVTLLSEQVTTVHDDGELSIRLRFAYRILKPGGRALGTHSVAFNKETKLLHLRGWSISKNGQEYEAKAKDAVETSLFSEDLYSEVRRKVLRVPSADPEDVVGFEYELSRRPPSIEDVWDFQEQIPVLHARYELHLPQGWGYTASWFGHPVQPPNQEGPDSWNWVLTNIPAIESEPGMPAWRALAGQLMISCSQNATALANAPPMTWADVAGQYSRLTQGRRDFSEEIRLRAEELAGEAPSILGKIRALARFVQRDIRYVSVQIGIGSVQPHKATEVFAKRYGDCKDKATLLSAMLSAVGVKSYYILVNSERGTIPSEFPSRMHFDHVILAIAIPEEEAVALPAAITFTGLGHLLLFDPTSTLVPVGELPAQLQGSLGLLVAEEGGDLIHLPWLSPPRNKLLRIARLSFSGEDVVYGEVEEVRWGAPAAAMRAALQAASDEEKTKIVENLMARIAARSVLLSCGWDSVQNLDNPVKLKYKFATGGYIKSAGNLLLIKPQAIGRNAEGLFQQKPRRYPVEFPSTLTDAEELEISFPNGLEPDELPPPLDIETKQLSYHSAFTAKAQVIRSTRRYQLKQPQIPVSELDELEAAYRQISANEGASIVLKRRTP